MWSAVYNRAKAAATTAKAKTSDWITETSNLRRTKIKEDKRLAREQLGVTESPAQFLQQIASPRFVIVRKQCLFKISAFLRNESWVLHDDLDGVLSQFCLNYRRDLAAIIIYIANMAVHDQCPDSVKDSAVGTSPPAYEVSQSNAMMAAEIVDDKTKEVKNEYLNQLACEVLSDMDSLIRRILSLLQIPLDEMETLIRCVGSRGDIEICIATLMSSVSLTHWRESIVSALFLKLIFMQLPPPMDDRMKFQCDSRISRFIRDFGNIFGISLQTMVNIECAIVGAINDEALSSESLHRDDAECDEAWMAFSRPFEENVETCTEELRVQRMRWQASVNAWSTKAIVAVEKLNKKLASSSLVSSLAKKAHDQAQQMYNNNEVFELSLLNHAKDKDAVPTSLHVCICIAGFMSETADLEKKWSPVSEVGTQSGMDVYTLRWGAREEIGVMAFSVAVKRAKETGRLLAHLLLRRRFGVRPVSLFGHSLGCRVIYECLAELARAEGGLGRGIIYNVLLMAGAVSKPIEKWSQCRSGIAGCLINCYCPSDKALSIGQVITLKKKHMIGTTPLRDWPLSSTAVQNHDLSSVCVPKLRELHFDTHGLYFKNLKEILIKIEFLKLNTEEKDSWMVVQ